MLSQTLIAIVDDDEILLVLAANALAKHGFATACFQSAPEFLAALNGLPEIRLLISDMQMPEMSGFDLQCRLEEMSVRIPIIFLTATVDLALASAMIKRGAVDILCKPLDVPALLQVVQNATIAKAA